MGCVFSGSSNASKHCTSESIEGKDEYETWSKALLLEEIKTMAHRHAKFTTLAKLSVKNSDTMSESLLDDKQKIAKIVQQVKRGVSETKGHEVNMMENSLKQILDAKTDFQIIKAVKEARMALNCDTIEKLSQVGSVYRSFLRIRLAYSFLVCLALVLAIFSGGLMQLSFSVYSLNYAGHRVSISLACWCMPFVIMVLALIGDEITDLVFDAFDFPPLTKFLAMLLACLHNDPTNPPTGSLCRCLDFVMTGVLDILPVLAGLLATTFSLNFFYGYVLGGIAAAMLVALTFVATEIVVAVRSHGTGKNAGDARATVELLQHALDRYKIFPGTIRHSRAVFKFHLNERADEYDHRDKTAEKVKERATVLNLIATMTVLAWTAVCIFDYFNLVPIHATVSVFFLVTFGLSVVAVCRLPDVLGPAFFIILAIFVCLAVGLIIGDNNFKRAAGAIQPIMVAHSIRVPAGSTKNMSLPHTWRGVKAPYPVCQLEWGSSDVPLSSLDLASLAWIVYEPNCARMNQLLSESFPDRAAQLLHCNNFHDMPRWASFYFPPKCNGCKGTRVVSVKGVSTLDDVFVDADLFATVKVMQVLNPIEPLLQILPLDMIQWIIGNLRAPILGDVQDSMIWESLVDNVSTLKNQYKHDDFVLTGHSLGGAIAQIAAVKLGLPALLWSAPGVKYSAKRFGVSTESAKRNIVLIHPEQNMLMLTDKPAAVVQQIQCRNSDGTRADPFECHSLVKSTCEIWRVCGDDFGRDFSAACADSINLNQLRYLYAST